MELGLHVLNPVFIYKHTEAKLHSVVPTSDTYLHTPHI
jgi:hypothetical protein